MSDEGWLMVCGGAALIVFIIVLVGFSHKADENRRECTLALAKTAPTFSPADLSAACK